MKKGITSPEGYKQLLADIKSILQKGLSKAYKAVDNIKVQTYWQIGERIVREELQHKERADYGERLIEKLTIDLDIQKSILYESMQFYKTYSIFHAVRGELSWTHYREYQIVTALRAQLSWTQICGGCK